MSEANPSFDLRHPAEIIEILDRLRREEIPATVEFGDGLAIVSSVLDIRRDTSTMVFDIARDRDASRRLFEAPSLAFVSEIDHIPILFETRAAAPVQRADGPAAVVALPLWVTRLQRREWFRAALPTHPPVQCMVVDRHGHTTRAHAIDLSGGGTGLVADDPALTIAEPGSDHELILSIPDMGRVELEATLRTVRPGAGLPDALAGSIRLGFRFHRVSPKIANHIQRYVQRLEVDQLRMLRRRGDR